MSLWNTLAGVILLAVLGGSGIILLLILPESWNLPLLGLVALPLLVGGVQGIRRNRQRAGK